MLPTLYLAVADIANPDLLACCGRTWISLDMARIYEEYSQPSSESAWPACPKHGNRAHIAGGGRGRHNLHKVSMCVNYNFCMYTLHVRYVFNVIYRILLMTNGLNVV